MKANLISSSSIVINASPDRVWKALIDPVMIKQYLFDTDAVSDWKVGSPITYAGVWEGKSYKDKGKIIKMVPRKLLETTYWSDMSGKSDIPKNYKKIVYELSPGNSNTTLTITQDNNKDENEKNHSEQNWNIVLGNLKKLLEK